MTRDEARAALIHELANLQPTDFDSIVFSASGGTPRTTITTVSGVGAQASEVIRAAEQGGWLHALAVATSTKFQRPRLREIADALGPSLPSGLPMRELRLKIDGTEGRSLSVAGTALPIVFDAPESQLALQTVRTLLACREKHELNRAQLEILGGHLFEVLFAPPVHEVPPGSSASALEVLREELDNALGDDAAPLRIVLLFADKPAVKELTTFPWEYLYVPQEVLRIQGKEKWPPAGFFIGEHENISLLRQGKKPVGKSVSAPCKPPLTVMTIDARAPDANCGWWQTIPDGMKARYELLTRPLLACLAERFPPPSDRQAPHVLHIVGKADWVDPKFSGDRTSGLPLAPGDGGIVSGATLWATIKRAVRLVVVESTDNSLLRALEAAADLVAAGCPAVLVMRQSTGAVAFVTEFYEQINAGTDIDIAMNRARAKLQAETDDFGSRVMFLQALGKIVDESPSSTFRTSSISGALTGDGRAEVIRSSDERSSAEAPSVRDDAGAPEAERSAQANALFGRTPTGGVR